MKSSKKSGFTLVEMLIVVVIMGILAAIVVPQFSQSSDDARYSSSIQNLQTFRAQIDLFKNQHKIAGNNICGMASIARVVMSPRPTSSSRNLRSVSRWAAGSNERSIKGEITKGMLAHFQHALDRNQGAEPQLFIKRDLR